MQFAIDPVHGGEVDVPGYVARYGQRGAGEDLRPPCVCPVCGQAMHTRGELTPNAMAHFAHTRGGDPCPSKASAAKPYLNLTPTDPDPEAGKRLKADFMRKWEQNVAFLQSWATYLGPGELDEMLQVAERARLWEHRHLQGWQVPMCLLMTREFQPGTSAIGPDRIPRRRYWFRFWFDAKVRSLDQLWIRAPQEVSLHRGSFHAPQGRKRQPGIEDLVRVTSHSVTPDLFAEVELRGSATLLNTFLRILARHLP